MIQRVVLFKLKPEWSTPEGRAAVAAECRRVLPGVAGVQAVEVAEPADPASARSWDLGLFVRLGSTDDLEPYGADAAHRALVDDFLVPRSEVRKAWNFQL